LASDRRPKEGTLKTNESDLGCEAEEASEGIEIGLGASKDIGLAFPNPISTCTYSSRSYLSDRGTVVTGFAPLLIRRRLGAMLNYYYRRAA
jgi:hypothetical protein